MRGLTDEELFALDHPVGKGVENLKKAQAFLTEVALVDYVEAKNQRGKVVSSRAILERRDFLLDVNAVEAHSQLARLPRRALKWVRRWQKRHGLTRGRFRTGSGLTVETQKEKAWQGF